MTEQLPSILAALFRPADQRGCLPVVDASRHFVQQPADAAGVAQSLNAAFLIALAWGEHPESTQALSFLRRYLESPKWQAVARFYVTGIEQIHGEVDRVCQRDPDFASRLQDLSTWLRTAPDPASLEELAERTWPVFFPEAAGIIGHQQQRIERLRQQRTVSISQASPQPMTEPARQVLFTSNVLLTVPAAGQPIEELAVSDELQGRLRGAASEPQQYWFDHPIQIGVEPEKNEVLYGLRGLDAALQFERGCGNMPDGVPATCVLSVSVTHRALHGLARQYLDEALATSGGLNNLAVYAFTEADTRQLVQQVLVPAANHYLQTDAAEEAFAVFGVDGRYGRHYSFLKAVAAFWNVLIDPQIQATFKIDLDQVFPQQELVQQTGASALEHLATPLWGAIGIDGDGHEVELGMLAGALVNESDIAQSLFTPDVRFPDRALSADECFFFSMLPQAVSTEAEMMTRYDAAPEKRGQTPSSLRGSDPFFQEPLDGRRACLQRIHVTGGTNGILVDSLRRHRPFTPSFLGRAEDQAYILSVWGNAHSDRRLAYAHQPGLIMRHDKQAFAQQAIAAAHVGKLVGDYVRLLYFSAYADVLTDDVPALKERVDPFTGCFISRIPTTVAYLRFALQAASFFSAGSPDRAMAFVTLGATRISEALEFTRGENSRLRQAYHQQRTGWHLYYDTLTALEEALAQGDPFARNLQEKAKRIADRCAIRGVASASESS